MQPGQDDPNNQQPPTPPGSHPPPPSDPFSAPPSDGTYAPPPYTDPYAAPTSGGAYQPPTDPYSQQPGYPPPPASYPPPPGAYDQSGSYQPGDQQSGQYPPGAYPQPGAYEQPGYQQPGFQQSGYQQPGAYPPPPYGGMPMGGPAGPNNTLGLVSMIMGIAGIPLALCCTLLSIPLGIAAIVTGYLAKQKVDQGLATNGGQAKAGLICGAVAVVLGILSIIASLAFNMSSFGTNFNS